MSRTSRQPRQGLVHRLAIAMLLLLGTLSCADVCPPPCDGNAQIDLALGRLAERYGPVDVAPDMIRTRKALTGALLSPARAFSNPTIWSLRTTDQRALEYRGWNDGDVYRMRLIADPTAAAPPGSWRRRITLTRIDRSAYEWQTQDELGVGRLQSSELGKVLRGVLLSLSAEADGEFPARLVERLPLATRSFGQVLRLEHWSARRDASARASVTLEVRLDAGRARKLYPRLAQFLEDQIAAVHAGLLIQDAEGRRWAEATLADNRLRLLFAVRGDRLVALDGAAASPNGIFQLTLACSTRASLFRVGFRRLVGQVTLVSGKADPGCDVHFAGQPTWQLPFFVAPFLRGPLDYPFNGAGFDVRFHLRERPGADTLLGWEYRLRVRESRAVRWLGAIGGSTTAAFHADAEAEARRLVKSCLTAFRGDLAVSGPPPTGRTRE